VAPTPGKETEAPGARAKPVVGNAGPLEVSVAGQTVSGQLLRKVNVTAVAPVGVKERTACQDADLIISSSPASTRHKANNVDRRCQSDRLHWIISVDPYFIINNCRTIVTLAFHVS